MQNEVEDKVLLKYQFRYKKYLGQGAFGKVIQCEHIKEHKDYALKIIQKQQIKEDEFHKLILEAEILKKLDHRNIIRFENVFESNHYLYIVMELSTLNLKQLIQEKIMKNEYLTDIQVSQIVKGILKGVEYMHMKDIVHRDLKPENILLNDINELDQVKIADFGLSVHSQVSSMFNQPCGTFIYMAPELISKVQYSKPVDLWNVGIIMYELLSNRHPLLQKGDDKQKYQQRLQNKQIQWKFNNRFTDLSKHLFSKLVCTVPSERYSADQALSHPWITRDFEQGIPLSFEQKNKAFNQQIILHNCL